MSACAVCAVCLLTSAPCLPAIVEVQIPPSGAQEMLSLDLAYPSADTGSSLRCRKLSDRAEARRAKAAVKHTPFSWIYDRPVDL